MDGKKIEDLQHVETKVQTKEEVANWDEAHPDLFKSDEPVVEVAKVEAPKTDYAAENKTASDIEFGSYKPVFGGARKGGPPSFGAKRTDKLLNPEAFPELGQALVETDDKKDGSNKHNAPKFVSQNKNRFEDLSVAKTDYENKREDRHNDEDKYGRNNDKDGFKRDGNRDGYKRDGDRDGYKRDGDRDGYKRDGDRDGYKRDGDKDGFKRNDKDGYKKDSDKEGYKRDGDRDNYKRNDRDGYKRDNDGEGFKRNDKDGYKRDEDKEVYRREGGRDDDRTRKPKDEFFGNFRQQNKDGVAKDESKTEEAPKEESTSSSGPPLMFTNKKKDAMTMAKAQELALQRKAEEEKNKPKEKPAKKYDDKKYDDKKFDDKKKPYKPKEKNDKFDRADNKKNYDAKPKGKVVPKKEKVIVEKTEKPKKERVALEKAELDNEWGKDDLGNILS